MRVKIIPLIAVFACFSLLLALGTWQVQRAQWKADLLATISEKQAAPAMNLPDRIENPAPLEYRHVQASGHFLKEQKFLVGPRVEKGVSGYHVYIPFATRRGAIVLVNCGFVANADETPPFSQDSERVEGVARYPVKHAFTPDNDPAQARWYWADTQEMAKAAGLKNVLPITLDATGIDSLRVIPNHHKQYAAFWYAMALILLGMAFTRFQQKKE